VLGWQHLTFHRLELSQACYSRFQTGVKNSNTRSAARPVHQSHSTPPSYSFFLPTEQLPIGPASLHCRGSVTLLQWHYLQVQPLLHSPAWVCPAARACFSPQPHPFCYLWLYLSSLPLPQAMICQPCSTKPWGFLHHPSSQRDTLLPFPRTPKHQRSFLGKKRVRNTSGCVAPCCPCPAPLMRCPSAPRCICTCFGDQHFPRLPRTPSEQVVWVQEKTDVRKY